MFILMVHALLFIGGRAKGEVTYSLIFRRPRVNKWVVIVTFEEEPLIGQIEKLQHNAAIESKLRRSMKIAYFHDLSPFSFPLLQKRL